MYHAELFELLSILDKNQRKQLKNTFSEDLEINDGHISKKLIIFLLSNPELPSKNELYEEIFPAKNYPSDEAFRKIVYRARNKVLELLFSELKEESSPCKDEIDNIKIKIHRRAAVYQLLKYKGKTIRLTDQLQSEIISFAGQYEMYSILLEQLNFKKLSKILIDGDKSIAEIKEKITFYERCQKAVEIAAEWNHLLKYYSARTAKNDQADFIKTLEQQIRFLKKEAAYTNSYTVKYYLLYHEFSLYHRIEKFRQAKKVGYALIDLIRENKPVMRESRFGIFYDNMAMTEIFLKNYKAAITCARNAQFYFSPESRNYYLSLELEFLANFYMKNYARAEEIFNICNKDGMMYLYETEKAKWKVYQVYLAIANKDYVKARKLNSIKNDISNDSVGWDFWKRVLNILLNIFIEDEKSANKGVESLKKQINRISKLNDFRKRDLTIYRILYLLYKEGYSTNKFEKINDLLEHLNNAELNWKPNSAELIPFENLLKIKYKRFIISNEIAA